MEDRPGYKLSYKIGEGKDENGKTVEWMMGWIEENNHPYFFVLNFDSSDTHSDLHNTGINMTKGMLRQLGFFEGKM
jgi:beta-lactamase class D